jgi:hypothetical protein
MSDSRERKSTCTVSYTYPNDNIINFEIDTSNTKDNFKYMILYDSGIKVVTCAQIELDLYYALLNILKEDKKGE